MWIGEYKDVHEIWSMSIYVIPSLTQKQKEPKKGSSIQKKEISEVERFSILKVEIKDPSTLSLESEDEDRQ